MQRSNGERATRWRAAAGTGAAALALALLLPSTPLGAQYPGIPPPPPCRQGVPARARAVRPTAIAVVYLEDLTTRRDDAFLAGALSRRLAERLRAAGAFPVVESQKYGADQIASRRGVQEIGRMLGARWLLAGSVGRVERDVRLQVRLVRATDGTTVWQGTRSVALDALPQAERALVRGILAAAGVQTTRARELAGWHDPRSGGAYEYYLRGSWSLALDTPESIRAALPLLDSATVLDPGFAPASARLALAYATFLHWGWWDYSVARREALADRGLAAADRALRLDSASAEAWSARGALLAIRNPRTFAGVRASHQRAVAADPRGAEPRQWYARALMQLGEDGAAAAQLERALAVAPRRALALYDLALLRRRQRRTADACALLDSAITSEPTLAQPYALRALERLALEQRRFAWSDAETAGRLGWPLWGAAASAIVDAGARDTAAARAAVLDVLRASARQGDDPAQWTGELLPMALAAAGERDRAIAALERAGDAGPALRFALRDPLFDAIRRSDRLRKLAAVAAPSPAAR
ncbi:MAG TPA: hypothetical protein VFS05_12760 [Gemmatimonadaceae bacterium]|nr:hypothetical protein [Gemmatimonadaceae bacterium]